jgi:hypothetical protein
MKHTRIRLLSVAAVCLIALATPVLAQSNSAPDVGDAASSTAPPSNNNHPTVDPAMIFVPASAAASPQTLCHLDHDWNGKYTAVCGPP